MLHRPLLPAPKGVPRLPPSGRRPHRLWGGALKLGLVGFPVSMANADEAANPQMPQLSLRHQGIDMTARDAPLAGQLRHGVGVGSGHGLLRSRATGHSTVSIRREPWPLIRLRRPGRAAHAVPAVPSAHARVPRASRLRLPAQLRHLRLRAEWCRADLSTPRMPPDLARGCYARTVPPLRSRLYEGGPVVSKGRFGSNSAAPAGVSVSSVTS